MFVQVFVALNGGMKETLNEHKFNEIKVLQILYNLLFCQQNINELQGMKQSWQVAISGDLQSLVANLGFSERTKKF